jgi:hypothetical protein
LLDLTVLSRNARTSNILVRLVLLLEKTIDSSALVTSVSKDGTDDHVFNTERFATRTIAI